MPPTRISLKRLALALDRYDGKYDAFEVFADDIEELHALGRDEPLPEELRAKAHGKDLSFSVAGKRFRLTLSENSAIAKITRDAAAPDGPSDFAVLGGIVGSAIGLASSSKGEGWVPGMILGLLAGHLVGEARKERSVTVRYDPQKQEWRAYGGPMSQWLRQRAAANS